MRCIKVKQCAVVAAMWIIGPMVHAQDPSDMLSFPDTVLLQGSTKLACEAVLCLSTSARPAECAPAIKRYFSITHRKLSRTIRARRDFLNLCPASSQGENMRSLISAMANGAGRCDANSLNATLGSGDGSDDPRRLRTSNIMPVYCAAYASHPYTDLSPYTARYVGLPERAGLWVEPEQYDKALAAYNARIATEDAAARNNLGDGS